jgi:uncharacterized membrane protein HdeD (DUF308 family)
MIPAIIGNMARYWWLLAIRGVLGILFGIAAFAWPGITLAALVLFLGAYLFVDGVFALVAAVRFRHERERWVMLLVEGILGIAVGAITFLWPALTAIAWVFTIAAWAIVTGVLEIIAAFRMRGALGTEILFGLSGVVSIIFGLLMAAMPLVGLVVWVLLTGIYAIVFGILMLVAAFRLRAVAKAPTAAFVRSPNI